MILWNDFVLDSEWGALLVFPEERLEVNRITVRSGGTDARNGASGKKEMQGILIQETRQEQRPARMVGLSSHDSAQVDRKSAGVTQISNRESGVGGRD